MKKLKGYIFSRQFMGERVPQHIQNIILRHYCSTNKFTFLFSSTEYAMPKSHLMLRQTIEDLNNYDGILAYSLFQLPEDKKFRFEIFEQIINKKKEFHFAVESMRFSSLDEFEEIEIIWSIRQSLNS